MPDTRYRLPHEVAAQIQVSPSTLRRWSAEFADFLSETAGNPQSASGGQAVHRRYSDQDLETLMTVKGLLAEGQTYIQVGKRLEALRLRQGPPPALEGEGHPDEGSDVTALAPSMRESARVFPAITVLADTLHTVADGQQLLLGSQQANRDMMTVLLQDNFRLKEENGKLRDRMLEMERDLAEIRRQETAHRDMLEARLQQLEDQARNRPAPAATASKPAAAPAPGRRGCLGQIFG
jgi:DNA-binding transcriptional MerR regulator